MAHRLMCLLRVRRLERGMTQEELSEQLLKKGLEVSQQTLSKIENNRVSMSPQLWRACSIILNVPMELFYDWPPLLKK